MPKAADADRPPNAGLVLADCGCGCGGHGGECSCGTGGAPKKPQLVYAIGRLGVSFVSQARKDSIWAAINAVPLEDAQNPIGDLKPIANDSLHTLFEAEPIYAQSVVWTLNRADTPLYAIMPAGAFAASTYRLLMQTWADSKIEFISLPGVRAGQVALHDGQIIDVVIPDHRGVRSWSTDKYILALRAAREKLNPAIPQEQLNRELRRFLGKIQHSIRNRGTMPEERALNAAAMYALNVSQVMIEAGSEGLTLRDVGAERSSISRPGSELYDVLLTFFDPKDRLGRAALRARLIIDVSDTVPVLVSQPETWNEY
jgi:hypothetical protein